MTNFMETVDRKMLRNRELWTKLTPCVVLLILEFLVDVAGTTSQAEINNHLELGKQFLARGQLSDALSHYHAAIEGDPSNYLTYFKRGTVYLALGEAKNALDDFDKVIELKPNFTAARISRGSVHLKLANYDLAQLDFYNTLQVDPYNAEANELIQKIELAMHRHVISGSCGGRGKHARSADVAQQNEVLSKALDEVTARIRELESRLDWFDLRVPKKYPQVKSLNYLTRKKILITGGAGFVGSHLVDQLMYEGHEVIVVDNFFTGRKRNVEHWIGHEKFELIHHDIVNPLFIEVDEIYHLASPASPLHYMHNPVKTLKTNTIGTINILGLARRANAKVLVASTSEVYGDPDIHPQPETYWGHVNPIGPRACYDEGKRVAETLTYAYAKQERIDVRVARIFNTFGPRMHMNDGRVVSNFILQALKEDVITVYGSGEQTRSFQYVSDLVDGLVALMHSNYSQPVNLGNPVEHTINEFATIIKDLVGGKSTIVHLAEVEDDPQRRRPNITRAKSVLQWEPKVSLNVGLQKTVEYFKGELQRFNYTH